MSSKLAQLKEINAQKKALAEQQKALREALDANKEERKEARKVQAQARKDVRDHKAQLRDQAAKVYEIFSTNDPVQINALADAMMESATATVKCIRDFAEAAVKVEGGATNEDATEEGEDSL